MMTATATGTDGGRPRKRKWDLQADDAAPTAPPSSTDRATTAAQLAADRINARLKSATPTEEDQASAFLSQITRDTQSPAPSIASSAHPRVTESSLDAQAAAVQAQASQAAMQKFKNRFQDMTQPLQLEGDGKNAQWVQVVDVNDQRNRYMVTKGDNQRAIARDFGATVTTKGKYYPDRNLATEKDPPLHLRLAGPTKEGVEKAYQRIQELLSIHINLTAEPKQQQQQQRRFVEDKLYVGLEPVVGFPLRAKLVGPQGAFVKHINAETTARIQLKGRGSGYKELDGMESSEPLYAHVTCSTEEGLEKAKKLLNDLIATVRVEYEKWRSGPFGAYGAAGAMYGGGAPMAAYGAAGYGGANAYGLPPTDYYSQQPPIPAAPYGAAYQPPPPPPPSGDYYSGYGAAAAAPPPPPPPPPEDPSSGKGDGAGAPPPPPPPPESDGKDAPPAPPPSEPAPPATAASTAQAYNAYDPYGYYAQYYAQYYGYDYASQQQQPPAAPPTAPSAQETASTNGTDKGDESKS